MWILALLDHSDRLGPAPRFHALRIALTPEEMAPRRSELQRIAGDGISLGLMTVIQWRVDDVTHV